MTGTQVVTVEPVASTLTLTKSPSDPYEGDTVTFTASASGTLSIREWIWTDSTGNYSPGCGTATTCKFVPPHDGSMFVRARVGTNNFYQQASASASLQPIVVTAEENGPQVALGSPTVIDIVVDPSRPVTAISAVAGGTCSVSLMSCTITVTSATDYYFNVTVNGIPKTTWVGITPGCGSDSTWTIRRAAICAPTPTAVPDDSVPTDAAIPNTAPNCGALPSPPVTRGDSTLLGWCTKTRAPSTKQMKELQQAITAIKNRGGVCTTLAQILQTLLNRPGTLKVYNQRDIMQAGGFVPQEGVGTDGVMALADLWFGRSAANPIMSTTTPPIARTLQQTLAHEADHLLAVGAHTDPPDNYKTTHSGSCSDVPGS